jgi:hypothetical protein
MTSSSRASEVSAVAPAKLAGAPHAVEIETNQEYWGVDFVITDSNFNIAEQYNLAQGGIEWLTGKDGLQGG